ncbi:unnamed protein product [Trichobilharzia regenti]|nr:unnamed protein product [Trichobilharzia regenti]
MLADAAVDRFNSKAEVYQHLNDHLPCHSVEAIKRRLQTLKWMTFVPSSSRSASIISSYSTPSSPASSHESYATRSAMHVRSRPQTWSAQEDARLISTGRCLDSPSLTPKQFFAVVAETTGNRTAGAIFLTSTMSYCQNGPSTSPTDVFAVNRSTSAPTSPCRTTSPPTVIISLNTPTQLKEQRTLQFAIIIDYTVFDESTQSMQIPQYHYAISTVSRTILYSPTAVSMIRPLLDTIDIDESVPTYTINAFSPKRTSSPTPSFEHEAHRQTMPTTRLTQDGLTPLLPSDPLSLLLFIMTMDEIVNVLEARDPIYIGGHPLHYIAYADDLITLAPNAAALQNKLSRLAGACGIIDQRQQKPYNQHSR